jgi:hypothetical protein
MKKLLSCRTLTYCPRNSLSILKSGCLQQDFPIEILCAFASSMHLAASYSYMLDPELEDEDVCAQYERRMGYWRNRVTHSLLKRYIG